MRIVLPAIGTAGDVNPMIALGMVFKARGYHTTIITNDFFRPNVEYAGLDFIPLGSADDYQKVLTDPNLWNPNKAFEVVAKWGLIPGTRLLYDILANMDPADTLVAAPGTCFGARLAQEKLKMPLVTIHLQPAVLISVYQAPVMGVVLPDRLSPAIKRLWFNFVDAAILDKTLAAPINSFRAELGLPAIRHIWSRWMHSPMRVIGTFPDWYAPYQIDWPANTILTGFIRYDTGASEAPVDPELAAFLDAGEAPIVFTPGSGMRHARQFFEVSIAAAQALGKRALLITQHPEQVPDGLPPSIRHVRYIPFSTVFPRTAAVVHHGGIGTTAQTLAAGKPHLVVPFAHDQPDNAVRLERLGVARRLSPDKYNARDVTRLLDGLINSADVQAKCRDYASRIDFDAALRQTCELIEECAQPSAR